MKNYQTVTHNNPTLLFFCTIVFFGDSTTFF